MRFKLIDQAKNNSPSIACVVFLVSVKADTMPGSNVVPVGASWMTWFCWHTFDHSLSFPMKLMDHRVCMLN